MLLVSSFGDRFVSPMYVSAAALACVFLLRRPAMTRGPRLESSLTSFFYLATILSALSMLSLRAEVER